MIEESDRAAVTIYRHRRRGHFLVQPMCRRGLARSEVGEPVLVEESGFESQITDAVLKALASYAPAFDPDRARRFTNEAAARFCREHDLITVVANDLELALKPAEHVRGGFQGIKDAQVAIATDEARERLPGAIREAFGRAR